MTDTLKDLAKAVADRLNSPVAGPFTIIWLIWHWQVPVVLVFGATNADRVVAIQNYLDDKSYDLLFWGPLLLTLLYIPTLSVARFAYYWLTSVVGYWIERRNFDIQNRLKDEAEYGATLFQLNKVLFQKANLGYESLKRIQEQVNDLVSMAEENKKKNALGNIHLIAYEASSDINKTLYQLQQFHSDQTRLINNEIEKLVSLEKRGIRFKLRAIIAIINY